MKSLPFGGWTVILPRLFTHLLQGSQEPRGVGAGRSAGCPGSWPGSDTSLSGALGKVPYPRGALG